MGAGALIGVFEVWHGLPGCGMRLGVGKNLGPLQHDFHKVLLGQI